MAGPVCSECGENFSHKRARLGYRTCLECGGRAAQKRKESLKERTAPAYNKGPYQFITDSQMVKDLGR